MKCGHCGNEIVPGYTTCDRCSADLVRKFGWSGGIGISLVLLGVLSLMGIIDGIIEDTSEFTSKWGFYCFFGIFMIGVLAIGVKLTHFASRRRVWVKRRG